LRSAQVPVDFQQKSTHPVANPEVFLRNRLVAWQQGFDATRLDDHIAALDAFDGASDELLVAGKKITQYLLTLGVSNLLQDHLLGGLGANAAKIHRFQRLFNDVAQLQVIATLRCVGNGDLARGFFVLFVRHHHPLAKGLVFASLAIDLDANVCFLLEELVGKAFFGG